MGYSDIGPYGADDISTPALDRLASEGTMLTDFYAAAPICGPSRAALLTGFYPPRAGVTRNLTCDEGLSPEHSTLASWLKGAGYATALFGKWHLGDKEQFLPLQHGFDEYFGLPYSNDMWPVDYNGTPITEEKPGSNLWKMRYPPLPLIDGNEKVDEIRTLEDQSNLTTLYTERAVRFIAKNKNKSFFLYLPHSMPHVPLAVSDKFKGKSQQGIYGDVIMEIDWSVGEILKAYRNMDWMRTPWLCLLVITDPG